MRPAPASRPCGKSTMMPGTTASATGWQTGRSAPRTTASRRARPVSPCVVTRYFGGILLGAGGLTRAYTKTAKMALDAAGIARRCVWDCVDISCSYAFLERARLELAAQSGEELNAEYGAAVLLRACLPQEKTAALAARLRELSAGTVTPVKTGNIYRAERVEK